MEEIFVPALGMAMDNAMLLEWLKQPGDTVNAGDVVAVIETDKTTLDLPAETSGVLGKHRYAANEEVPAGNTIAVVLAPGEVEQLMSNLDKSTALSLLRQMMVIRDFEETADKLCLRGKVPGGMHNSSGQEAVAVGTLSAIAKDDVIATTHRSHHHTLAKGYSAKSVMAELFTKATGISHGRGGSMHLAEVTEGHFGGNGIVGAGVGIAMGAALGIQHIGDKKIAVGFVGDGGMNTGRTWESINMASIWKLPLIILVDNNQYAVETFVGRVTGGGDLAKRASGFGLPAYNIDGQDVLEVRKYVTEARERALAGEGPTFINALTYRYYGHNVGEKGQYRTQEEIAQWRTTQDPIDKFTEVVISSGFATQAEVEELRASVRKEIEEAVAFAESSPEPEIASITQGVDSGKLGVQL